MKTKNAPRPPGQPKMRMSNSKNWEMVDVVIAKSWFPGRKIWEVAKKCPAVDVGLRWGFHPPGAAVQKRWMRFLGHNSQLDPPVLIMTSRVHDILGLEFVCVPCVCALRTCNKQNRFMAVMFSSYYHNSMTTESNIRSWDQFINHLVLWGIGS